MLFTAHAQWGKVGVILYDKFDSILLYVPPADQKIVAVGRSGPNFACRVLTPRASYKWVKVGIGPVEANMHNAIKMHTFYQGPNGRKLATTEMGKQRSFL